MSIADIVFLLASLALPIQLSKFFWPNYSFVLGIPIDYRSPSIYLNEILIVLFVVIFLVQNRRKLKKIYQEKRSQINILAIFNLYLFSSSAFFSISKLASFVFNIRILVFSIFFISASVILKKNELRKKFVLVIAFSAIWEAAIVFYQLIFQKSLGAWFLGERSFDSATALIAHFNLFGSQILRPYGTFPHPNALAAFFALSLLVLVNLKRNLVPLAIAFVSGLATFSKSFILSLIFIPLPYFLKRQYLIFFPLASILIWAVAAYAFHFQIASFSERLMLIQASLTMLKGNLLFGFGSNNFILQLAKLNLFSVSEIRLLQPVHNIFFLIFAENGLIGLSIFLFFLISVAKVQTNPKHLAIFVTLMIFASLDHFFWTLAQGRLLFFIVLAYIASSPKASSS